MNKNVLYFTQRVASAAASALVYVVADMISQKAHKKTYPKRKAYQKSSYANYAPKKHIAPTAKHQSIQPQGYRSISEQAKEQRQKGRR